MRQAALEDRVYQAEVDEKKKAEADKEALASAVRLQRSELMSIYSRLISKAAYLDSYRVSAASLPAANETAIQIAEIAALHAQLVALKPNSDFALNVDLPELLADPFAIGTYLRTALDQYGEISQL